MIHIALLAIGLCLASPVGAFAQTIDKQIQQSGKNRTTDANTRRSSSNYIAQDNFDEAYAALLEGEQLQFKRPFEEVETPREFREPPAFFRWLGNLFATLGPVFQILFYIGIIAIAAAVLYFVITQIPKIRLRKMRIRKDDDAADDHVISTVRPDQKKARSWLEEADALAKEGKFSEAVHLILFRSIEDIQSKQKQRIPTALTAREIERLEGLPERPRNALRPIIALVEQSFFGGHKLDAESWASARASYEDFAFGEAWT